jgi:hypothetical protein
VVADRLGGGEASKARHVRARFEFFDFPKLGQIARPKRVPLLDPSRRGHVEFLMNPNTLLTTNRTKEDINVLIATLQLATVETCEGTVAHGVPNP